MRKLSSLRRPCAIELLEDRWMLSGDTWALADAEPVAETRDGSPVHGPRPEPRIVGGGEAIPGEWPWTASLQFEDFGHSCGGSLISPNVVVTAAHCVFDFFDDPVDPDSLTVVLGRHDLRTDEGEELGVSRIVAHPNYDPFTIDSDIAVLLLSGSSLQQPIDYVSPEQQSLFAPGVEAVVAGWGEVNEFGPLPDRLHEVTVPIVSNQVANAPQSYAGDVTDNMLAAGLPQGGPDSCYGDSGGPLMVPDGQGGHSLAGIVSWGFGCGQPNFYGIYTRVASFSGWLDTFVGQADDAFEPNNALASSFDLVTGDQMHHGLTIHHADGDDWYRWTAPEAGQLGVDLTFRHADGDLDLQVYDKNGKFLAQSTTVDDNEQVVMEVTANSAYYIRVFGLRETLNVTYSLTLDGPGDVTRDFYEPNDSAAQATDLFFEPFGALSLHGPADEDWFRLAVEQTGTLQADLAFAHALGNVDLQVYDDRGLELVASSLSETDAEQVKIAVTAGEEYLLRIFSADSTTNPRYRLTFSIESDKDRFEPNDRQSKAFDLVTGDLRFADLSIHTEVDEDWFQWTAPARGSFVAEIDSDDSFADLDLELYDADGNFLDSSTSFGSNETVRQSVQQGDTLLVHVISFFGAVSSYSLRINGPGTMPQDEFEQNDDPASATPLVGLRGESEGLTLHSGGDEDWYSWQTPAAGTFAARIQFPHALSDLTLELHDADGELIASSATADGQEYLSWNVSSGQEYHIRVFSADQAPQPTYDFSYELELAADRFEPNGSLAEAFDLITGDQRQEALSLNTETDQDWYAWMAPEAGKLTVSALFSHSLGDVDLELFGSNGRRLVSSVSTTDDETVEWDVEQDATYLIRVRGAGAEANPSYTLVIDGPGTTPPDSLEPNDDASSATQLSGSKTVTSMVSIHDSSDVDWYRWTAPAPGMLSVQLTFASSLGALELALLDEDEQLLAGGDNSLGLSHPVETGETYLVRVSGADGSAHPRYGLSTQMEYGRDGFEANDLFSTAYDLVTGDQVHEGLTLHDDRDEDWFRWTSPADDDLRIVAEFDRSLGDITLELYDIFGTLIETSSGRGSRVEIRDVFAFEGEDFTIRVFSPSQSPNPGYRFTIDGPEDIPADASEDNNTMEDAFDLAGVSTEISRLSLADGDEDWFRWTAPASGQLAVQAEFRHLLGDVDLQLFNAAGRQIASSASTTDDENVTAMVRQSDVYFIRVVGFEGQSQPRYDLSVTMGFDSDVFEPNDTREEAVELSTGDRTLSGLSLHSQEDDDWFQWTAVEPGELSISLESSADIGSPQASLYDSTGKLLASSSGAAGRQSILWRADVATYYVRVFGPRGAAHPAYQLKIDGPGEVPSDRFEPNNRLSEAHDLGGAAFDLDALTLNRPGDQDWFTWTAADSGMLTVDAWYDGRLGVLAMELQDAAGTVLASSATTEFGEQLAWNVSQGQQLFLKVSSPGGASAIAHYDLRSTVEYAPDEFEPNESPRLAANLGGGDQQKNGLSLHRSGDQDWFSWTALAAGTVSARLDFAVELGDIQLELHDTEGLLLSSMSHDTDMRRLTWSSEAGETYLLRAASTGGSVHPDYSLSIVEVFARDAFEPNDESTVAYDLVSGDQSHQATLDRDGDVDWYQWTTAADGPLAVAVAFDQAFGTLDLQLYDRDRTLVADGQRQDNQVVAEWVVSSGMTYLIRVGATGSGKHPGYSLLVDGPGGIVPDRFEPNDDFAAAADLGRSGGTYERLSIHEPNDQDWYRWTAPANGAVTIELTYPLPLGDVDLALYNASQKLIASSSSDGDTERVAWPVVSGETFFIRAFAFGEAVSPSYTMTVIAPASPTPLDCSGDGVVNIHDADCASLEMLDATLNAAGLVRGDANGDGAVQFGDFVILADNFGQPGQYTQGDFDKNGRVDFADFVILADNFEQPVAAATTPRARLTGLA